MHRPMMTSRSFLDRSTIIGFSPRTIRVLVTSVAPRTPVPSPDFPLWPPAALLPAMVSRPPASTFPGSSPLRHHATNFGEALPTTSRLPHRLNCQTVAHAPTTSMRRSAPTLLRLSIVHLAENLSSRPDPPPVPAQSIGSWKAQQLG